MPNIINIPELKGTLRFLPKLISKWPCFHLRSPNSHDATRVPPRIKHKQGSTPFCSPNLQVSSTSAASSTLHSRTCAISFLDFNPKDEDPALPCISRRQNSSPISGEPPSLFFILAAWAFLSLPQVPSGSQLLMHIHDCGSLVLERGEDILAPTFSLVSAPRFHCTQRPGAKIPSEPRPLMHIHH